MFQALTGACPNCGTLESSVLESRAVGRSENANKRKRRRLCLQCNTRYTTYEINQDSYLALQKKLETYEQLIKAADALVEAFAANPEFNEFKKQSQSLSRSNKGVPVAVNSSDHTSLLALNC